MNSERNPTELDRRAAKHAALADPARLRIVDLLTLGDCSPSELQAALAMPSNLMAHHLRSLEAAGLVVKGKSEADHRRSYLTLADDAFAGLEPGQTARTKRVVFVCTANSARSHLAELLWRQSSDIPSASAGTRPAAAIEKRAFAVAERHGLRLPDVAPRSLGDVLEGDDLVVTVCDSAHEELGKRSDVHWSVPDPVRVGSDRAFEEAYRALAVRVAHFAPRVTEIA